MHRATAAEPAAGKSGAHIVNICLMILIERGVGASHLSLRISRNSIVPRLIHQGE